MGCCHYYEFVEGHESVFAVDPTAIRFGPGVLNEIGYDARRLGLARVALYTDRVVGQLEAVATATNALRDAGVDVAVYNEVRIEPTDESFAAASKFASEGNFDGFISVGGGSVMDTCKAANLYATYPAELMAYVNAPIGEARPVPGPLKPHIACPTTSGTGSECTGIAVFDLLSMKSKTGIAHRALRPTLSLIDPTTTYTLPANVVAASGFDVLSHALESYTAVPFTYRHPPERPELRPMSQGANPYSDIGCLEALRRTGRYLVRAVADADDHEARDGMMFAATLAGIAFGNSGVHIPHGMSYSVAGLVRDFRPEGYPQNEPICPHGMSVIVNSPSAFRFSAPACPERHLKGAMYLGADSRDVKPEEAGEVLATHLIAMMRQTGMPNGISGVGYNEQDIPALAEGAIVQQRLLKNAPIEVQKKDLETLYRGGFSYW
ncbi:MAG: hydroxyacid-oxoacid transhydrogenase [Acidiferrobacterales bacterium]